MKKIMQGMHKLQFRLNLWSYNIFTHMYNTYWYRIYILYSKTFTWMEWMNMGDPSSLLASMQSFVFFQIPTVTFIDVIFPSCDALTLSLNAYVFAFVPPLKHKVAAVGAREGGGGGEDNKGDTVLGDGLGGEGRGGEGDTVLGDGLGGEIGRAHV